MTARGFDGRSRHRIGRGERRRVMRVGPDFLGLSFALFFLTWSMGPSLLPRGWVVQGVVSGLADATGYGVGLALAFPVRRWVVPKFSGWSPPPRRVERVLQLLVVAGAAAMAAGAAVTAADRRRDLAVLVEMPSSTTVPDVRTALLAAAVFGSVLVVARGLATAARGMGELLRVRAHLPAVVAHAAAPLGLWLAVVLVVDVVVRAGSSDPAPCLQRPERWYRGGRGATAGSGAFGQSCVVVGVGHARVAGTVLRRRRPRTGGVGDDQRHPAANRSGCMPVSRPLPTPPLGSSLCSANSIARRRGIGRSLSWRARRGQGRSIRLPPTPWS